MRRNPFAAHALARFLLLFFAFAVGSSGSVTAHHESTYQPCKEKRYGEFPVCRDYHEILKLAHDTKGISDSCGIALEILADYLVNSVNFENHYNFEKQKKSRSVELYFDPLMADVSNIRNAALKSKTSYFEICKPGARPTDSKLKEILSTTENAFKEFISKRKAACNKLDIKLDPDWIFRKEIFGGFCPR